MHVWKSWHEKSTEVKQIHLRIRKTIAVYEMANKIIVHATEDPEFFCVPTSYNYGQRGSFNFFQLVSKLTGN